MARIPAAVAVATVPLHSLLRTIRPRARRTRSHNRSQPFSGIISPRGCCKAQPRMEAVVGIRHRRKNTPPSRRHRRCPLPLPARRSRTCRSARSSSKAEASMAEVQDAAAARRGAKLTMTDGRHSSASCWLRRSAGAKGGRPRRRRARRSARSERWKRRAAARPCRERRATRSEPPLQRRAMRVDRQLRRQQSPASGPQLQRQRQRRGLRASKQRRLRGSRRLRWRRRRA